MLILAYLSGKIIDGSPKTVVAIVVDPVEMRMVL